MSQYLDELNIQSRKKFLTLQAEQEKRLIKIYSNAGNNLVKQYIKAGGGTVTKKMLQEHINHIYSEVNVLMQKYGEDAASLPAYLQEYILTDAAAKAGFNVKLGRMFTNIPKDAMSVIINGGLYSDGKGLSDRIWSNAVNTGNNIQNIVLAGLARGQSALGMARELEQFVDPIKRKNSKNLGKIMGSPYGNVEYNALRLARTTNTHASIIANKMACKKNPYVEGLKWNVSASHGLRMHGKSDICDQYNGKVFPIDDYPFEHPNGLCYPTPEITKSTQEIANELKDWVKGGKNSNLDNWYKANGKDIDGLNKGSIISKLWKSSTTEEASKELLDKFKIKSNYEGLNVQSANFVNRTIAETIQRFPILGKSVYKVSAADLKNTAFANAVYGHIKVNTKFFNDLNDLESRYSKDVMKKFHPKGTSSKDIIVHEMGHTLDSYLASELGGDINDYFSKKFKGKVMKAAKLKQADIKYELSEYATKEPAEFFAEAFAEYVGSPTPRPLAKIFGEMLEEVISKL